MRYSLALLLLASCGDDTYTPWPVYTTNEGYSFDFLDKGSLAEVDVCSEFDAAVLSAKQYLWVYGIYPDHVEAVLKHYNIRVIDAFLFATPASVTGYATGAIAPQRYRLMLALYRRQKNADGPEWTWFDWGGGNVHSGIPSDPYCPALGHELGHHFFGADFGHGWLPPEVNPSGTPRLGVAQDWTGECGYGL